MSLKRNLCAAIVGSTVLAFTASGALATEANEKTANGVTTNAATVNQITTVTNTVFAGANSFVSFVQSTGGNFGPLPGGGDQEGSLQFKFERDGFKTLQQGAAAGGVDGKLAVWINGGYSTFDEDQTAIDSDGDTFSLALGADWAFTSRLIAGLSVSGSVSDVTTTFNDGDIETTGYTISPYFVTILGNKRNLLLDGAVGYTLNDNDAKRTAGTITSSYDSSTWFAAANLTYLLGSGNFRIQPKVGILWVDNTTDGYTESGGLVVAESDTQLGRLSAGARIEYAKNERFIPYISVTGEYDFESEDYSSFTGANRPSQEDKGAVLGAGASIQLSDRSSASVGGTATVGRDDYSAYTVNGTLRFNF